jgi:hypothetical protein
MVKDNDHCKTNDNDPQVMNRAMMMITELMAIGIMIIIKYYDDNVNNNIKPLPPQVAEDYQQTLHPPQAGRRYPQQNQPY